MALAVRMGIRIRAPREFVFQHLLTPHHLARWFCNFAQFDMKGPAVGSKFRFGGDYAIAATDPPGWPCEILGGEVLKAVSFKWPLFGAETRVDWRADETAEGSTLRVVHTNLPREESTCGRFQDAWRVCLGNLKAVAEARDDSLRPDSSPIQDRRVRLNVLIDAPPSKVFSALVERPMLAQWTEDLNPAVEPRAAGVYRVRRLTEPTARIVKLESGKGLGLECPDGAPARRLDFSLEEKGGNRTGLYLEADAVHQDAGLRLRCAWSDLLVGLKNALETGETGFTEPYAEQVGRD